MPGGLIEISVLGEDVLKRRLLRVAGNIGDQRDAFRQIARLLRGAARKQFGSSGAYGGARWAALKPETLARKRRLGLDLRILRATHGLMDSLASEGSGHVEDIGSDYLRWGSSVEYGKFHMTGTRNMPARHPMRLSPGDRRAAVKILQRSIFGGA